MLKNNLFLPRLALMLNGFGSWFSASLFFGLANISMLLCANPVLAEQPKIPLRVGIFPQEMRTFYTEADGLPSNDVLAVALTKRGLVVARTVKGDVVLEEGKWNPTTRFDGLFAVKKKNYRR